MGGDKTFDEKRKPSDAAFEKAVGRSAAAWRKLRQYLYANYEFSPELFYDRKNAVWFIRYRKSGKTLCTLIPEKNAFTVLVVLGKKEGDRAETLADQLSSPARTLLKTTEQLHDGRWLWIKVKQIKGVKDIQVLMTAKRKPKRLAGS
jgi:hypothetical protein